MGKCWISSKSRWNPQRKTEWRNINAAVRDRGVFLMGFSGESIYPKLDVVITLYLKGNWQELRANGDVEASKGKRRNPRNRRIPFQTS